MDLRHVSTVIVMCCLSGNADVVHRTTEVLCCTGEQQEVLRALKIKFKKKTLSKNDVYALVNQHTKGINVNTFYTLHFTHGVEVEVLKTLTKTEVCVVYNSCRTRHS